MSTSTRHERVYAVPLVANGDMYVVAPDWTDEEPGAEVSPAMKRHFDDHFEVGASVVDLGGTLVETLVYQPDHDGGFAYCLVNEAGVPVEAISLPAAEPPGRGADWARYFEHLFDRVRHTFIYGDAHPVALDGAFVAPNFVVFASWGGSRRSVVASETVATWSSLHEYSRLVLLGEPGAGKTSCLQRIVLEMLSNKNDRAAIPIFIRGRDVTELTIQTLLANVGTQDLDLGVAELERLASNGSITLLLDGLDEASDESRQRVVVGLDDLAKQFPLMRIVCSTRASTYNWELESFVHASIAPFSDEQVNEWLWLQNPDERFCREFVVALSGDRELKELARTPLLLSYVGRVLRSSGQLPRGRAALYAQWTRHVLTDWDESRGIQRRWRGLTADDAVSALGSVAWHCSQTERSTFRIADVTEWLQDSNFDLDDQEVERFVRSVGILTPVGKEEWGFTHRAIFDFLVAEHLVRSSGSILAFFSEALAKPAWHEPWHLACELASDPGPLVWLVCEAPGVRPARRAELLFTALSRQPRLQREDSIELVSAAVRFLGDAIEGISLGTNADASELGPWALAVEVKAADPRLRLEYRECVRAVWTCRDRTVSSDLAECLQSAPNPAVRELAELVIASEDEPYQLVVREHASRILFFLTDRSPFLVDRAEKPSDAARAVLDRHGSD